MLCVIDINRELELEFTLQVLGSSAKSVEPRFIIIGPQFGIVCLCSPVGSNIKVQIPKLEGILPLGKYKVRFEIILGEQIYVPVEDQIELKGNSRIAAAKQENKPTIAVTFASSKQDEEPEAKPEAKPKQAKKAKPIKEAEVVVEAEEPPAPVVEETEQQVIPELEYVEDAAEEIVAEAEAIVQQTLMQEVQAYHVPFDTVISNYVTEITKRSPVNEDERKGFSFIKTLSK